MCGRPFVSREGIQDSPLILDLTSWIPDSAHWILVFVSENWILDSKLKWEFRIPLAVFRITMPRILDSTSQNFPDSANWIPLHGVKPFNGLGEEGKGKGEGVAFYWEARGLFLPLSPSCIIYVQSSVLPVYNPFPRWSLRRAV